MDAALIALAVLPWVSAPASLPLPDAAPMVPSPIAVAATLQRDAQDVNYDSRYYERLELHRWGTKALLPLFALQYLAGSQLADEGSDAPSWARFGHRVGATGVAAMFIKNVYSGLPILATSYKDPNDKGRRFTHISLMLLATAGFTYTGILADRAEGSPDDRELHRTMAITSMGIATVGYLTMTDLFRRD